MSPVTKTACGRSALTARTAASSTCAENASCGCFFYWYGDHRDLHSFPPRRSSDLRTPDRAGMAAPVPAPPQAGRHRRAAPGPRRSEEHTSELQSHSDLVCRLLLEKKKKNTTQTTTYLSSINTIKLH